MYLELLFQTAVLYTFHKENTKSENIFNQKG